MRNGKLNKWPDCSFSTHYPPGAANQMLTKRENAVWSVDLNLLFFKVNGKMESWTNGLFFPFSHCNNFGQQIKMWKALFSIDFNFSFCQLSILPFKMHLFAFHQSGHTVYCDRFNMSPRNRKWVDNNNNDNDTDGLQRSGTGEKETE